MTPNGHPLEIYAGSYIQLGQIFKATIFH